MKNFAVLLSGCGVFDGSEIYETVCSLIALEKNKAKYQCVAPDMLQTEVINHLTHQPMQEKRNVLVEAARLARGNAKALSDVDPLSFDGLIVPGGFGAAKNLSNFASQGEKMTVNPEVLAFCRAFAKAKKPAGYICIAPTLISAVYGPGVKLTIGNDPETAKVLEKMGSSHERCAVDQFVKDETHNVASVPAYMLAKSILEAQSGIEEMIAWLVGIA